MEFIGADEAMNEFTPNVSALLLNTVDSSAVEGFEGDQIARYLDTQSRVLVRQIKKEFTNG